MPAIIEGMVTLSDVMGALVGDVSVIDDEEQEADAVQRDDGSWLLDGGISQLSHVSWLRAHPVGTYPQRIRAF